MVVRMREPPPKLPEDTNSECDYDWVSLLTFVAAVLVALVALVALVYGGASHNDVT